MGFCVVVHFLKSCRKFLFLDLLQLISYGFLDLSNTRKFESFQLHFFNFGVQKMIWRRYIYRLQRGGGG